MNKGEGGSVVARQNTGNHLVGYFVSNLKITSMRENLVLWHI